MKIARNIESLDEIILQSKRKKQSIGFVPTMGALHEGHLSLLRQSILENDFTVCSIYVNPTQFNDKSDFIKYPRDNSADIEMLALLNCDLLFLPSDKQMYPDNDNIVECDFIDYLDKLEGEKRPGHFLGVLRIIYKLFSLINPDRAYFGEKDYQQLSIIKLFTKVQQLPVQIKSSLTVRDSAGLALSSRNQRLTIEEKENAKALYQALKKCKKLLENSHKITPDILFELKMKSIKLILKNPLIKLDYFEVIEEENFRFAVDIKKNKKYRILIAAYVGRVRLIDNVSMRVN